MFCGDIGSHARPGERPAKRFPKRNEPANISGPVIAAQVSERPAMEKFLVQNADAVRDRVPINDFMKMKTPTHLHI